MVTQKILGKKGGREGRPDSYKKKELRDRWHSYKVPIREPVNLQR